MKRSILFIYCWLILAHGLAAHGASTTINGKQIECKHAREISTSGTTEFRNSPAEAIPAQSLINYNSKQMGKFSTEAQAWVLCHECGHLDNNPNEMSADSYGLACAVQHNLEVNKVVADACGFLANAPASNYHPAGSTRCENLRRTAQCMNSMGGDNSSCLQANGDPSSIKGGGGAGGSGGGGPTPTSLSPELAALAQQMSSAWIAQENKSAKHSGQASENQPASQTNAQPANNNPAAEAVPVEKKGQAGFADTPSATSMTPTASLNPQSISAAAATWSPSMKPSSFAQEVMAPVSQLGEDAPTYTGPLSATSPEGFNARPQSTDARRIPAAAAAADISRQIGPDIFRITSVTYQNHCKRNLTTCAPAVLSDGMK